MNRVRIQLKIWLGMFLESDALDRKWTGNQGL